MNKFIPFIVKVDDSNKTLQVVKTAGDKAFGNPEAAIKFLGGIAPDCKCISSGDYRQLKRAGYKIVTQA